MDNLKLSEHANYINDLVSKYIKAKVEIVDKVVEHYENHCGRQHTENIEKLGMALWKSQTEPNRILLQKEITTDEINDHLLTLYIRGFNDVYYILLDSYDFLTHLVLHEVAHIKNNWDQNHEKQCDDWAFEQFKSLRNQRLS